MAVAFHLREPRTSSRRRTGVAGTVDRCARRIAPISLFNRGQMRWFAPCGPSRGVLLRALVRQRVSKGDEVHQSGSLGSGGVPGQRDLLSSAASALVLTVAVTFLPLVSQPGAAMADVADASTPKTMSEQELQYQQYEQYQKQYKEYQQQQSAYEQMQAKAQPLQKAEVNKGRIWLLFVLGASSLFGVTVVVENNGSWFPAISRANKAMKVSMKAIEERERLEKLGMLDDVRAEAAEGWVEGSGRGDAIGEEGGSGLASGSTQDAVLAGLREASANAKQTMKSFEEERKEPTMIPLELYAGDGEDEIAVDVVDMQAEKSMDDDDVEFDDIASLLDEPIPDPIPGQVDESDAPNAGIAEMAEEQDGGVDATQRPVEAVARADAASQADDRKPLFEISGEDIDASITSRAQQFKEELERNSADGGSASGVDLSGFSLEELQKELESRRNSSI